ncbi:hypothetical protein ACFYOK_03030 [Microbispora bryophytorum]|uniref:hypothetical protein n=1 Tax=Microbispora bryophytorum TaxID=1460882 RepID=UPI0033F76A0F
MSKESAHGPSVLYATGTGIDTKALPRRRGQGHAQDAGDAAALANHASLVLADEPTGQLDSAIAEQVFDAFRTANEKLGTAIVFVTHDRAVASAVDRTVAIRDGRTVSEVVRHTSVDDEGRTTIHASEYATVDRAGRLQLPRGFTYALDIRDRVRRELEPDHIAVRPDQPRSADSPGSVRDVMRRSGSELDGVQPSGCAWPNEYVFVRSMT